MNSTRLLEILPGALSWTILLGTIVFSFFIPNAVAVFIVCYTLYWLYKSVRFTVGLAHFYLATKREQKKDFQKLAERCPQYDETVHAILYVTYQENIDLVRKSISSYVNGHYPSRKIIFVFAGEERDRENALSIAEQMEKEFGDRFFAFLTTLHPSDIPGEIKGKSGNATWAGKKLQTFLDEKNIPYENVILSNFDADTIVHPKYFSELTYRFLIAEKPTQTTFQPYHLYHNNCWDVPAPIRLLSSMMSFHWMSECSWKNWLFSFSSRSMSFKLAYDTNFWDPSVIPEDSRQYWTAYAKYDGHHEIVTLACPLFMNAVQGATYFDSLKAQYCQIRRWAYGVCDLPFVMFNVIRNPKISLLKRLRALWLAMASHVNWAIGALYIFAAGHVPQLVNPEFRYTLLGQNFPVITTTLLNIAAIGLITGMVFSVYYTPKQKKIRDSFYLIIQWLLLPLVGIFFSSLPALEAQTRLMFNKRLEYTVAPKGRLVPRLGGA